MKKFGYALFCLLFSCIFCWSCIPPHSYAFTYVNSPHQRTKSPTQIKMVYIDQAFGESDRVAIADALTQWEYALNGYMTFKTQYYDVEHGAVDTLRDVVDGRAWMFLKINSTNPLVDFHDMPKVHALAFCERVGGSLIYMVRDRVPNDNVKGVMMHEIGHLLGAQHWDEDDDLMNPIYREANSQCIDKHTLQQVSEHLHIPVQNMNYCVYTYEKQKPDEEITTVRVYYDN